ncbi:hypothetical protein GGI35DRAFT_205255 [Trichoderma velutinum]
MLCFAEQSPWLDKTGWKRILQGGNRAVLSLMIEGLHQQVGQPHVLLRCDPNYLEDDVISASEDEGGIAAIVFSEY